MFHVFSFVWAWQLLVAFFEVSVLVLLFDVVFAFIVYVSTAMLFAVGYREPADLPKR